MEFSVVKLELELLEFFIQGQLCFDAPVPEDHRHWVVGLVIEIFASNQLDILALLQLQDLVLNVELGLNYQGH